MKRGDLVDPGPGFVMLDRKLANARVTTFTGEVNRTCQHLRAKGAAKKWDQYLV